MRKKRNREGGGVRDPRKEKKKHLRSDRGAWETAFIKQKKQNILTIPLQSCSLLYYNTHVHAHGLRTKKRNHENGKRGYENYYFHVVGDRLDENQVRNNNKKPTLNSLKPQQAS